MSLEVRPHVPGTEVAPEATRSVASLLRRPYRDRGHPIAGLASAGLAAAALAVPGGPVRLAMLAPFVLLGPGCALLSYVRLTSVLVSWALAVTASLTGIGLVSAVMIWTTEWYPLVAHVALVLLTAGAALHRLRRDSRPGTEGVGAEVAGMSAADERQEQPPGSSRDPQGRPVRRLIAPVLLVLSLGAWLASLPGFRLDHVDYYGLTFALGIPFVAAVVLTCLAFIVEVLGAARTSVVVAAIAVLVLITRGTASILLHFPQYPWTYKHIGVVDLFLQSGRVLDARDIYQQWPTFFSTSAYVTDLSQVTTVALARWAPLFFTLVQALLVAGVARAFTENRRVIYATVVLFVACTWPETNYFSPQAFAYTLMLGFFIVLLTWLRRCPEGTESREDGERRARSRLARARAVLVRGCPAPVETSRRERILAAAASVLVFFAITSSHQLTPVLVLASVAALSALGLVRPRSLVFVLLTITLLYVLPRTSALAGYRLFTGLDIFNNSAGNAQGGWATAGQAFSAVAVRALSFAVWGTALFTAWRSRRHLGWRIFPLVLAFTPFVFLIGGNYGGELIYRVYVFSLPLCGLLIADHWAAAVDRRRSRGRHRRNSRRPRPWLTRGLTTAVLSLGALTALQGTEGQLAYDGVSADSVAAAQYFYDNARPGSALVLASPDLPTRLTAGYRLFNVGSATDPALTDEERFRHRMLDAAETPAITGYVDSFHGSGHYLAISRAMAAQVGYFGYLPAGSLDALADALRVAPGWRVFYQNDEVVLFERTGDG